MWWRFRRVDQGDRQDRQVVHHADRERRRSPANAEDAQARPKGGPDQQAKRYVIPIELQDVDTWLLGSIEKAATLMRIHYQSCFAARELASWSSSSRKFVAWLLLKTDRSSSLDLEFRFSAVAKTRRP